MRTHVRTAATAIVIGGLTLTGVTACGRGGSSGSNASSGTHGSKSSNQGSKAKIAIVTRDFSNPYWAALRDGAVAEGKAQGVTVTVKAGANETDSQGENAQIQTLAGQDYNCFGVVPVNATNVITPLVPVARKKIPILDLDTQIDPEASKKAGVSYASFIGSDNLSAGEQAGQELLKAMGGKGDVAVLQGIAGEQNGINRLNGFKKVTAGKLTIVAAQPANYDQNLGLTVTTSILQAHPNITGIFSANDTMALGAAQAVKNAGKEGKIKIVSVDGIQAMLSSIKAGKNTGTMTQYPYVEGQMAVQACIDKVAGKSIPSRVVAPIAFINAANVDKAISNFPKPFTPFDDPFGTPKSSSK
ncbi:substrate-binding domain-containing protein [Flexivirga caeni]|uniref:Sugar ABC transporter substrate-binding protein n=1 Tax=Flexivirga caeni TaxID=2294115 RepID=A0A3M9M1U7_9MICO|nr:substrate-binding domain-containing protein [Flexivirga caeni]RNI19520.1 sugar ABC transporter substrate-binding protein [Flexivirga caeni]